MKNKFILSLILGILFTNSVCAQADKISSEYLKNKKHFSILNPFVEKIAEKSIKKSLKKSTGENFAIRFDGYTLYSMKKGVFKNLEIEGDNFQINGIDVKYLKIKTLSDYNKIDYTKKPIVINTDMVYEYELQLTENSINQALDNKKYKDTLDKINNLAYPLFVIKNVDVQIKNNKLVILISYNFPISPRKNDKRIKITTGLKLDRNKIVASDVDFDSSYGALPVEKVTNLINLLDPLTFTLDLMNTKKCNSRIEKVQIIDNIIKINGKIYVKGE